MHEGEKCKLIIPSEEGFGAEGIHNLTEGVIVPPHSTLYYCLQVVFVSDSIIDPFLASTSEKLSEAVRLRKKVWKYISLFF